MLSAEEILSELEVFGVRLGLASTSRLLGALGRPERAYPVLLVAGTNGKGSTSAALASILRAAGYRVGLYTSPHLEAVEERIRVDGRCIASDDLARRLAAVVELGQRLLGHAPTYFEALTVAAYDYFAACRVDVAVMEVGLGGRLDATNVAEPVAAVVTSISRDHTAILGDRPARIAREKAGIFRPGRPAFVWVEDEEALASLTGEARRKGALLVDAREGLQWTSSSEGLTAPRRLELLTPWASYRLETGLIGSYQVRNLGLAVVVAEGLAAEGWRIDTGAIEAGIAAVAWPGRCEAVRLPDGRVVLLDAAHNQEGVALLAAQVEQVREQDRRDGGDTKWVLIFGALDDKPAPAMLPRLAELVDEVVVTAPRTPRAFPATELLGLAPAGRSLAAASSEEALAHALESGAGRLLVCGSIYLVGEVRKELRRLFGSPPSLLDGD